MSKIDFIKNINKNTIFALLAVVGIVVAAGLVYANSNPSLTLFSGFGKSKEKIAEEAINYINENQLSSSPASLVGVSEESGLIKITIEIGGNEFDSYVSKDGKLLFPQAIEMIMEENSFANTSNQPTEEDMEKAVASIEKSDNPVLQAYVVSMCPFGIQMQRIVGEIVKTLPELSKYIQLVYMGDVSSDGTKTTAMHGDAEATENLRQICIREEQSNKFWSYLSCYMKEGDDKGCESSTGINSSELNACMSTPSRGVAYAKKDFDLNEKYGVTGSPTLILNEKEVSEFNFGGRTAEAVKSVVCAGFKSKPDFCSITLNTDQAAASFSTTYSTGTSSDASCE
jgi:hypothetical protein